MCHSARGEGFLMTSRLRIPSRGQSPLLPLAGLVNEHPKSSSTYHLRPPVGSSNTPPQATRRWFLVMMIESLVAARYELEEKSVSPSGDWTTSVREGARWPGCQGSVSPCRAKPDVCRASGFHQT